MPSDLLKAIQLLNGRILDGQLAVFWDYPQRWSVEILVSQMPLISESRWPNISQLTNSDISATPFDKSYIPLIESLWAVFKYVTDWRHKTQCLAELQVLF